VFHHLLLCLAQSAGQVTHIGGRLQACLLGFSPLAADCCYALALRVHSCVQQAEAVECHVWRCDGRLW
jgi:hypothetical protein